MTRSPSATAASSSPLQNGRRDGSWAACHNRRLPSKQAAQVNQLASCWSCCLGRLWLKLQHTVHSDRHSNGSQHLTTVPSRCRSAAPAHLAACGAADGQAHSMRLIEIQRHSLASQPALHDCTAAAAAQRHNGLTPQVRKPSNIHTHTLLPFMKSSGRSVSRLSRAHAIAAANVTCRAARLKFLISS